jgi:peptidyl-prolyl cis-trans isomerase B (cyclophilin B)
MTRSTARSLGLHHLIAVCGLGCLVFAGCGQKSADPKEQPVKDETKAPAVAVPAGGGKAEPAPPRRDGMHQSFADATRSADNPPADAGRPADQTVAGKATAKLLAEVARLWDTIRFTGPDGKPIDYTARLETDLGNVDIVLLPDFAPNHVRNFIALARAGYYDGLLFERVLDQKGDDGSTLRTVEGGCPLGTGEPGRDSIGYWLKPEFQSPDKIAHDAGVVGACRGAEPDSAACRFYITLGRAPVLDGNFTIFGKVTPPGLDVVRKIYVRPAIIEDDPGAPRRPEKPVVIRKVTIQAAQR